MGSKSNVTGVIIKKERLHRGTPQEKEGEVGVMHQEGTPSIAGSHQNLVGGMEGFLTPQFQISGIQL